MERSQYLGSEANITVQGIVVEAPDTPRRGPPRPSTALVTGLPTTRSNYTKKCVSRKYTRLCQPGHGLYEKQFPRGTCAHEPSETQVDELQLVGIGNLSFMCPEEYLG